MLDEIKKIVFVRIACLGVVVSMIFAFSMGKENKRSIEYQESRRIGGNPEDVPIILQGVVLKKMETQLLVDVSTSSNRSAVKGSEKVKLDCTKFTTILRSIGVGANISFSIFPVDSESYNPDQIITPHEVSLVE